MWLHSLFSNDSTQENHLNCNLQSHLIQSYGVERLLPQNVHDDIYTASMTQHFRMRAPSFLTVAHLQVITDHNMFLKAWLYYL